MPERPLLSRKAISGREASGDEQEPIKIGVSACLLGSEVRYDGGHKRDRFLTDLLAQFVDWVSVCPEVESGMGIPRPPVRLVREAGEVRMVETDSGADHTQKMKQYAARRVRALRKLDLSGFVLKKSSPSCGMERVKIYGGAMPEKNGRALFAEALLEVCPRLPVEEEGRLNDARLRENFIERVFAYRRLRALFQGRWTNRRVVEFHTAHKLQLMAHAPEAYRELGRLVASVNDQPRREFRDRYEAGFMGGLSRMATPGRNTNVLQHAAGYLKKRLDPKSREELAQLILDYQAGLVPLIVPITLLRHHARQHEIGYLLGQTFLAPHPKELMLRNRV